MSEHGSPILVDRDERFIELRHLFGERGSAGHVAGGALLDQPKRGATHPPSQYAQLREARFNEEADHPLLVRTYETFVVDDPSQTALHGAVVVAMEPGERNLQDALGDVEPVSVITAICEALVHIHGRGGVHGDLKPGNVLLMADGSVRLADFGLARELEGTHAYAPRAGPPDYLPPEWWSERVSQRGVQVRSTSDIWALGVTIHQVLTGGLYPFPGAGPRARAAAAQAYADRRATLRLADELPAQWRPIVADCLTPNHASRLPHTAASILARIPGRARAHRRRWVGPAAAGAAAVALGGVVLALTLNGHAAVRRVPLTVFNAEVACQTSSSDDCRLGLVRDPYAKYAPANVVGRVRHGDRLAADCYVSGATIVTAEDGRSSDRWYHVHTRDGEAWLPAVRLAPAVRPAVDRCDGDGP